MEENWMPKLKFLQPNLNLKPSWERTILPILYTQVSAWKLPSHVRIILRPNPWTSNFLLTFYSDWKSFNISLIDLFAIPGNENELRTFSSAFSVTFSKMVTESTYAQIAAAYKAGWEQEFGGKWNV